MVNSALRGAKRAAAIGVVVAVLAGGPAASAQAPGAQVHRFPVQNREAADIAERVRALLDPALAGDVFINPTNNEVVVRGGEAERRFVAEVIAKLDQPVAGGRPAGEPVLQAYAVPPGAEDQARAWADAFRGAAGERAAWDERTGQLIVFASPRVHQQVGPMLRGAAEAAAGAASATEGLRLLSLSPNELHARLEKLVSKPIAATWDAQQRWLSLPVELGGGPGVRVRVDARDGVVKIEGEPAAAAAWRKVIASLDAAPAGRGQATQLVTASRNRQPAIRRALAALGESKIQDGGPGRMVAMQVQPEQEPPEVGQPAPDGGVAAGGGTIDEGALLGPVQVEFVEGLDIIVLRGNAEDVARVQQIINQIEQLSAVTAPTITVHPLKHVASVPMANLLLRIYQQALGARTGAVSVTPLGKPNALLLIGRDENVQQAIALADKLDQPVEAATRFEVFPLRHAVASDAKTLIDEYLTEAEQQEGDAAAALTPTARVIADYRSNSLIITAAPREIEEIRKIVQQIDVQQAAAVDEVRVFPLRNSLASDLAEVLRTAINQTGEAAAGEGQTGPRSASLRFVTIDSESRQRLESGIVTSVRIAADERANSLVVAAPADSMDLIAALIAQLDRSPDAEAELKVFTIANGDAVALREMLTSLFRTDQDPQENGGVGAGSGSLVRLSFSVDERTNSIIAAGSREDLDVVYAILTRLDGADNRERINKVFRLNNAYSVNVAESLTAWLDSKAEAEAEAELTISPFEQIDREVIIVADESSNSLIISATPEYYDEIEGIIRQLDEQPPMVMMQVLIAEVRLNDTDEFGLELGLQDSLLFDRSLVGDLRTVTTTTQTQSPGGAVVNVTEQNIVNAPLTPGFNFNDVNTPLGNNGSTAALATAGKVAAQGLSNFGVGRINNALGFGGFVLSASSSSIDMLLRALQENRRLEVLSRPQITMLDGQPGRISVGQSVPRIDSVNFNDFGQSNTLTDVDVGIILEVTPRISPSGQVVMQVSATRSEVGNEAEGTPVFIGEGGAVIRSPAIDQTVAETTVMAASGQTIVLGGLITKSTFDIHRRVPILADIPLLGDLFRYDSVSQERTELLIIMTPRVIRSEQDAEMIKQIESARMSWVLCDVVNLHGPSGLRSRCDEWGDGDCEAVFPSYVPAEGELRQPAPSEYESYPDMLPAPPTGLAPASSGVETAGYNAFAPAGGSQIKRLPPVR